MNGCDNFESFLARRLHGPPLSPAEEASLSRHMAGCAPCRRAAEGTAALHEALLGLPGRKADPPPRLRPRIAAALGTPSLAAARLRRAVVVTGAMAAGVLLTLAVQRTLPGGDGARTAPAPAGGTASLAPPAGSPAVATAAPPAAPSRPSLPAPAPARLAAAPRVEVVREVKIFLFHPDAKQVAVTGDFNGWDPEGVRLRPGERPGLWEGELRLGPGAYSYNFIVDGDVLVPDPSAADQSPDGYGGTNSILLVKGNRPS